MASETISTTIKLLGQLDPSVQKAMVTAEKVAKTTSDNISKAMSDSMSDVVKETSEINKKIVDIGSSAEKQTANSFQKTEKIADISSKKISAAMIAGFTAVSAAVAAIAKQIADIGDQYQQASGQIAATTGATGEELAGFQDVMKNVYGNNFGEDMNDVANAISNINQQMSGLSGVQLESVTEQAFMLRDVFEYDIPESIRAANAITNQFGTDAEYAMNLIATGAQNGLDYSGELLDTISEYSVQFAKVGFSADDMFNIMQVGADTGAWNLDKVGDAIGELSKKVVDGSETTAVAFGDLGLDAQEMAAKFASGGETARDAFFKTVSALANMDDKVQQNIAGVGLFGTMWEDLGPDVVLQLASISDGAYATKNAFEQINNVKYNNLSSALEGVMRKVDVALLPLGEKLASAAGQGLAELSVIIEKVSPYIEQFTDIFSEKLGAVIEWLAPYVMPIFDTLINGVQKFIPHIMNVVNALAPFIDMLKPVVEAWLPAVNNYLGFLISYMSTAASVISGVLVAAIQVLTPILQKIVDIVIVIINKFSEFFQFATEIFDNLSIKVSNTMTAMSNYFTIGWNLVSAKTQEIISSIATWLVTKWGEIKTGASEFLQSIKTSFSENFGALVGIVKAPFDKILGFIDSVKSAVSDLWGKITGTKNEAATIKVPKYATGGTVLTPHLALVGDAPETIVPHGNTAHNQALLMEAAKGVFGSDISSIANLQSKIIDFPQIQTAENELEIPEDDFEYIEGGGDIYNFNVVINIDGGSDDIKQNVIDAEQEFERRIEQYFERKKRRQFA